MTSFGEMYDSIITASVRAGLPETRFIYNVPTKELRIYPCGFDFNYVIVGRGILDFSDFDESKCYPGAYIIGRKNRAKRMPSQSTDCESQ